MKRTFFSSLATIFAFASLAGAAPNIIFVLTDDLGYGDLGIFHQNTRDNGAGGGIAGDGLINGAEEAHIHTPNLDTLAREGAMMTRHYTSAPVCAPARGSLLLGRDQGHANVRDNSFDKALEDNHTLGTVLKSAGYTTACIGKWGLQGSPQYTAAADAFPTKRGFDFFFGYLDHGAGHRHYPKEDNNGGNPLIIWENSTNVTSGLDKCYSTDLFTARAKKWIVDHRAATPGTPFFLYLTYTAPHAALEVATQAYPSFSGANDSLTGGLQWLGTAGNMINTASGTVNSYIHPQFSAYNASGATARHGSMIRRIDNGIGDIKRLLADLNIDDNTIIVFTSDNGPHHEGSSVVVGIGAAPEQDPRNFQSYGNMDGTKRDHWEAGIRVPTIAWWPGNIDNNDNSTPINSTRPSAFHDWMATLIDAAGSTPPAFSNGVSLLPELTGTGTQRDKGYLYFEYRAGGFNSTPTYSDFDPSHRGQTRNELQTIFLDNPADGIRYKGVRYNVTSHSQNFRIYDVDLDPGETNDLAASHTALQQQMKDKVLQVRIDGDYPRSYLSSQNAPPATPASTVNGLDFKAYTGTWDWVPETACLSAAASGTSTGLDLSKRTRDDNIALEFTGYISVPTDGTYTFQMTTDSSVGTNASGGMMWIHDAHVIDDDFKHSGAAKSGSMRLKAGKHPIRILYKHSTGSHDIHLQYSGPGIALQTVPESALFRNGVPDPEPTANPDNASTSGTTPVSIPVLANDTDDGAPSPLSIQSVTSPSFGSAAINGTHIDYTADAGKFGTDQFSYTITDGTYTATALVTVSVTVASADLWFPLNETSGSTVAEAGGTIPGAHVSAPVHIAGKHGYALNFDGVDDLVSLTGVTLPTGNSPRTVAAWVRVPATSGVENQVIFGYGVNNDGERFSFRLDVADPANQRLRLEVQGGSIVGSTRINDGAWHHVAVVIENGSTNVNAAKLYVDGVLETVSSSSSQTINTSASGTPAIGASSHDPTYNFKGDIDEVRVCHSAKTAGEIAILAADTNQTAAAWLYRHYAASPPAWTSDTDADGTDLLGEYAFGGNPHVSDRPNVTASYNSASAKLEATFTRRKAGTHDLTYSMQVSNDLSDWLTLTATELSTAPHPTLGNAFERVTVETDATSATEPRLFMRAVAE
ncbi:MAG: sulfatase-like hydrolase/transferase [Akkermansiaceae bacterium]|nr:sulfatase-like hydrolase/transferase [Akkermansiaceae bacterium]